MAALAEGRLEDESEARSLIESSPDHLAEHEAQKAAIEALRSAPAAALTEHERAALRRDVWAGLNAGSAPAAPRRRRWAPAAVVVVLVIGSAVVLNRALVNTSDRFAMVSTESDTTDEPTATTAAAEASDEEGAALEYPAEGGPVEESGADEGSERLPESVAEDPLITFLSQRASRLRQGASLDFNAGKDSPSFSKTHASCVSRAALEVDDELDLADYEVIDLVTAEETHEGGLDAAKAYLIAVPAGIAVGPDSPVAFIELETCVLAHFER